ncbi:MAG TPA: hypothetical protein EYN69_06135, partial [Flavobacteriales bacterium]|nr:hypothetical protein [Flavobacteriales bacterium]
ILQHKQLLPKNLTVTATISTKGIEFIYLDEHDVVRHELVKKVIKAFSKDEK